MNLSFFFCNLFNIICADESRVRGNPSKKDFGKDRPKMLPTGGELSIFTVKEFNFFLYCTVFVHIFLLELNSLKKANSK
jgi:hypothetical protein